MRDTGDTMLVFTPYSTPNAHQHRAFRSDLASADQKAQFAGAGDEDSAQHRAPLKDRGEGDHALVVDDRKTEAVEAAAAWGWITARHQLAQHAATVKIKHLQRLPASPDRSDKGDFIPVVQHRRIEFDEGAVLHAWCVGPAQRDSFEAVVGGEKNP